MLQQMITLLIGIFGGAMVGMQTPIANAIGQRIGSAGGSLVVHVSGAVISALLLIARGGESIQNIRSVPWWMFGVGIFGVVLFLTINYTVPRLGATGAITLIIVGQLGMGMIIDQFGLFDVAVRAVDGQRIVAVILLLVGAYLMAR